LAAGLVAGLWEAVGRFEVGVGSINHE
jgi:hypothetical protein